MFDIDTTEQLPITIHTGDELAIAFKGIKGITERLSAQLNFQTMTAGWFGDEENIFTISFAIDVISSFEQNKALFQSEQDDYNEFTSFSDDVCCCYKKSVNHLNVNVAITESELTFLTENKKVLRKYLETKLIKVVNLIASKFSFHELHTD